MLLLVNSSLRERNQGFRDGVTRGHARDSGSGPYRRPLTGRREVGAGVFLFLECCYKCCRGRDKA